MSKRAVLLVILGVVLIYPLISFIGMNNAFHTPVLEGIQKEILNYQLSIWICWLIFAGVAVFYKWKRHNNLFFLITYVFLIIGFGIFGLYYQKMIEMFDIPSMFKDTYILGLLVILQNLITSVVLTIFLQVCVWWFTRSWHRR
ncbi:MAG TPA: hypothetical protein VFM59_04075 [Salinimicrobium sp.]|nr:hypothetical protein [Salinimicrobium sp.]